MAAARGEPDKRDGRGTSPVDELQVPSVLCWQLRTLNHHFLIAENYRHRIEFSHKSSFFGKNSVM
jgi:hypothetical protein